MQIRQHTFKFRAVLHRDFVSPGRNSSMSIDFLLALTCSALCHFRAKKGRILTLSSSVLQKKLASNKKVPIVSDLPLNLRFNINFIRWYIFDLHIRTWLESTKSEVCIVEDI